MKKKIICEFCGKLFEKKNKEIVCNDCELKIEEKINEQMYEKDLKNKKE